MTFNANVNKKKQKQRMKASISLKLLYRLRCITFSVRIVPFTVERRQLLPGPSHLARLPLITGSVFLCQHLN